jgi:hypothetical protein
MKNIADYLPFYIGQECITTTTGFKNVIEGFSTANKQNTVYIQSPVNSHFSIGAEYVKPILKPLNVLMTPEEKTEHDSINESDILGVSAMNVKFLCSKGYDVFGLIKEGLAIEKKL